uniref:NADH-ubiquinone oxidoreductase chain 4 n=1 Tax=Heterosigma akashiwo TaxID=2829 RepID=A0A2Z5W7A4_HETAK|nr:NADH dehydrogenase subunit 4 [Heterosigma akashiwo]
MLHTHNILSFLIGSLFMGAFLSALWPSRYERGLKIFALNLSFFVFFCSLFLWIWFDQSTAKFQFVTSFPWFSSLNINCTFGVDGISLFLVLLTTLLFPLCLLGSWHSIQKRIKEYVVCFLIMEAFLICVFCVMDLLLFYIFFEGVLIPMFVLIGIWGSRERKIRAAYLFFLYTLFGSLFMLLAILYIFVKTGTTDYEILAHTTFSSFEQKILWLAFFASFATKVPMLPMHIWLPEAHVEAPTAGSVILAGILLKLGTYGFLRFSLPLFPEASYYFTPLVYTMATLGVIYTSFTAIRQTDLKRIIAYASVAHMNLVMMGLFSFNLPGLEGALLQSLSHGFVSSALFLCIGVLYDRYHTRMVKYYSGLVHVMPISMVILLFFTMANIGLPGTSSFVGEFLILVGIYQTNTTVTFLGATGMILGGGYSLWLYNRIAYGNLKTQYLGMTKFSDISKNEFFSVLPLIMGTLVMGIYPEVFLDPMHVSVNHLLTIIS